MFWNRKKQTGTTQPKQPASSDKLEPIVNNRGYFRLPIWKDGLFQLRTVVSDEKTSWFDCTIIDISASGTQIMSALEVVPVPNPFVVVAIQFELENVYVLEGEFVRSNALDGKFQYGIRWISLNDEEEETLVKEILRYQINARKVQP